MCTVPEPHNSAGEVLATSIKVQQPVGGVSYKRKPGGETGLRHGRKRGGNTMNITLDELIDKHKLFGELEDEIMEALIETRGALREFMIVTHPATNATGLSVEDARCRARKVLGGEEFSHRR